jgi:hypothetical protein
VDPINPNEPNHIKIDLNELRAMIVALQKDGFVEIGLGDLLWFMKSAQKENLA